MWPNPDSILIVLLWIMTNVFCYSYSKEKLWQSFSDNILKSLKKNIG